jgi:hypothetical protein
MPTQEERVGGSTLNERILGRGWQLIQPIEAESDPWRRRLAFGCGLVPDGRDARDIGIGGSADQDPVHTGMTVFASTERASQAWGWRAQPAGSCAVDLVQSPVLLLESALGVGNPPPQLLADQAERYAEQLDPLRWADL